MINNLDRWTFKMFVGLNIMNIKMEQATTAITSPVTDNTELSLLTDNMINSDIEPSILGYIIFLFVFILVSPIILSILILVYGFVIFST